MADLGKRESSSPPSETEAMAQPSQAEKGRRPRIQTESRQPGGRLGSVCARRSASDLKPCGLRGERPCGQDHPAPFP